MSLPKTSSISLYTYFDPQRALSERLSHLDQGAMSTSTNLSDGLRTALKVFYEASTE